MTELVDEAPADEPLPLRLGVLLHSTLQLLLLVHVILQHVLRDLIKAATIKQHAARSMQQVACSMQHAACSRKQETGSRKQNAQVISNRERQWVASTQWQVVSRKVVK